MESIIEDKIPRVDPAETEERFQTVSEGDTMTVYLKKRQGEFYVTTVTVQSTRQTQDEQDDVVRGVTSNGEKIKMTLRWYPQEPNVGIPRPYPEGPISVTVADESYEVMSIVVE